MNFDLIVNLIDFFDEVRVRYVRKAALQVVTSDFNFLVNLNTPQDFLRVISTSNYYIPSQ